MWDGSTWLTGLLQVADWPPDLMCVCVACRTGKTQICHTLCVTTQMPHEMGGGAGKVSRLLETRALLPAQQTKSGVADT